MLTICAIGDQTLIEAFESAKRRLLFAAPGISERAAQVLAAAWSRLGAGAVSVIIDINPEVCRMGYGALPAIELLQRAATGVGAILCHQPGLRIGFVLTDERALVFAPTPLLIETGTIDDPGRVNGLILSNVPPELAQDLGAGPAGHAEQAIGLDQVNSEALQHLISNLNANPPLSFDVSRHVHVFNSRIEFVEFHIEKIQLQRQEIPIPQQLNGFDGTNIHTLFRLDPGQDLLRHKEAIESEKRRIEKRFTHPLRGFASIIKRVDKPAFEREVEGLRLQLEDFRNQVRNQFRTIAAQNKQSLIDALIEPVKRHPPFGWEAFLSHSDGDSRLRDRLGVLLSPAFDKVSRVADEMRVVVRYKGVTYESLTDREFIAHVEAILDLPPMESEFIAARGR